jgi:rod shape determining protein RodA
MIDRRIFQHFDYFLILLILPFVGVSLFLVYEISESLAKKEIVYILIGFTAFFITFLFPFRKLIWIIPFFYGLNLILLIMVDLFGISILGAQRWLQIPIIGITIQPSEFMKTNMILMLGFMIYHNPPPKGGYRLKDFAKLSLVIIIPFLLIAKEPDLGTAMVLMMIGFGVLFIVGVHYKIWATLFVLGLLFIPFAYHFIIHDYQKKRIDDFLGKPSYHVQQSIIAMGSGGLVGKDKEEATQTQLKFLPVSSSDFIVAYLIERFGFLGIMVLLSFYFILIYHILSYVSKLKKDYFAISIFSGVGVMIFIYSFVNIAMTIGFAPVVGVPLPLVSHGGTSFINFMILFGILENLLAFRFDFLYNFSSQRDIT